MSKCIVVFQLFCFLHCSSPVKEEEENFAPAIGTSTLFTRTEPLQTNILFSNTLSDSIEARFIQEYRYMFNGGGVAIGDINNDGLNDIFFTGNEVGNKLYLNIGDFQFKDITTSSGIDRETGWSTGVTMVDINADGLLDIYVCRSYDVDATNRANILFENQGDLKFASKAEAYGINDRGFSTQAAFFDYDLDGLLDLYVLNHPDRWFMPLPINYSKKSRDFANQDMLYKNLGNGTFKNISTEVGLVMEDFGGYGLGIAISDLDNDNDPDIYVSNDYESPDYLYMNNGDGTFSEQLQQRLSHTSLYGMGVDIADFDNDGFTDIYALDMAAEDHERSKTQMRPMQLQRFNQLIDMGLPHQYMYNALQKNAGDATFSEIGMLTGVNKTDWSWGPLIADLDLDGNKDLFVTNGFRVDDMDNDYWINAQRKYGRLLMQQKSTDLAMQMLDEMPTTPLKNYVYQNKGKYRFIDKSDSWGLGEVGFSQGAAYGDLDNDGDFDLVVNNLNDTAWVYRNNATKAKKNNYLRVNINGPKNNKFAIGAKILLTTVKGSQKKEIFQSRGFQSSVSFDHLFGIKKDDQPQSVKVVWPDGRSELQELDLEKNEISFDYQNSVILDDTNAPKAAFEEVSQRQVGLNFNHKENEFNDYQSESLLPYKYSMLGPFITKGDLNNDGLDDFFIGGASGSLGKTYFQTPDGNFKEKRQLWTADDQYEDIGSCLFDVDGDGDLDLYVVSGGNEPRQVKEKWLEDRLYINDGMGSLTRDKSFRGPMTSGSIAISHDYDQDGDMDLFVGGRQIPGKYPHPSSGTLLLNENGKLIDKTLSIAPELISIGMVTDAKWLDLNADGNADLLIVGEWMSPTVFENQKGQLKKREIPSLQDHVGWWNSIEAGDFDNDGDVDLIAGNLGLNYKYKANMSKPFHVYAYDFDASGTLDIVFSYLEKGNEFPLRGKDCSSQQMPFISQKFQTYQAFSEATLYDIYGENLESALHYSATNFASIYIENLGNWNFLVDNLPMEAQFSSINDFIVKDFNADGHLDLITAGNLYQAEIETPRNDASHGLLLLGTGKGRFTPVSKPTSGLDIRGDVKDLLWIERKSKSPLIISTSNNGPLNIFTSGTD